MPVIPISFEPKNQEDHLLEVKQMIQHGEFDLAEKNYMDFPYKQGIKN